MLTFTDPIHEVIVGLLNILVLILQSGDFVTTCVIAVSLVKIWVSQITVLSKMSHCGDCVWRCVYSITVQQTMCHECVYIRVNQLTRV